VSILLLVVFSSYVDSLVLDSFPTRRSSDLCARDRVEAIMTERNRRIARQRNPVALRPILAVHLRADDPAEHQLLQSGDCLALDRSEEHTSELQSHLNLVCRLLLEKKQIR